jgi:hypothetical protein
VEEKKEKQENTLSTEQYYDYMQSRGSFCPVCKSTNILGTGEHRADGEWHSNEVECLACGSIWDDIYTLSDVEVKHFGK